MALATINSLIGEALDSAGNRREAIRNVVVSGNTTMAHLLLQIEPCYLRRAPHIPTVSDSPILKAGEIGLLTDIDRGKFAYMGNSSIVGAYMALLSTEYRQEARDICNSMTYVDFSSNPGYMNDFTSALFLPHTDLKSFPTVAATT